MARQRTSYRYVWRTMAGILLTVGLGGCANGLNDFRASDLGKFLAHYQFPAAAEEGSSANVAPERPAMPPGHGARQGDDGGDQQPFSDRLAPAMMSPPLSVEELMGKSPDEVAGLLGAPNLVRHENPARIWQYAAKDCVLFLFFYGNQAGGGEGMQYLDSRRRDSLTAAQPQPCLTAVAQRRSAVSALIVQ